MKSAKIIKRNYIFIELRWCSVYHKVPFLNGGNGGIAWAAIVISPHIYTQNDHELLEFL